MTVLPTEGPRAFPIRAALPFFFAYLVPLFIALGLHLGGGWTFAGIVFAFIITPALDGLIRPDTDNAVEGDPALSAGHCLHRVATWGWVPIQVAFIGWGVALARGELHGLSWLGAVLSVGLLSGAGINVAHELMHRRDRPSRALAEILMTTACYPHFCVEHILGHHVHVATPADPASAPLGMGLYRFLLRTLWGSLRSAWRIESKRVQRLKIAGTLHDRRLRYPLSLVSLTAGIGLVAGPEGAAFFWAQGAVAILFLEIINYVEHYGLRRPLRPSGRYAPVTPAHSWNSAHRVTRFYLFSLPRHADHHHQPSRPFWRLRHLDGSPQLPAGYATMMLLALCPVLWRKVMDPRVRRTGRPSGDSSAGDGQQPAAGASGRPAAAPPA